MSREPSSPPGAADDLGVATGSADGSPATGPITPGRTRERERFLGGVYAFGSYFLWGFLALYFLLLAPTGPWELVAWRILLSLVFCALMLTITRSWPRLLAVTRQPRLLGLTAIAGVLIYVNWQVFMIGTLTGHVIETSLGYFINPLATIVLGVFVLHERLRLTQWIAVGLAAVAVGVIVVGYGSFPWIALTLAVSFSLYGLVKKRVGPTVDAVSGLTLESLWLLPVGVVLLVVVSATTGITMGAAGPWHALALSGVGVATAVPLLLFAAGARRVPLTVIGLLQFLTPVMQFITGAWILGEPMPVERWIGFGLVWAALALLATDSFVHARRARGAA